MVKQLFRLIAALALAGGALLTVSGPACACSCVPNPDMSERIAKAEAVFVGRVVDTKLDGQTKTLTFAVDKVYKGLVLERQEILTARDSAGCGLEIQGDEPWIVFGTSGDHGMELEPARNQYTAILCGGADPVTPGAVKQLGTGSAPADPTKVIEKKAPARPASAGAPEAKPQAAPEQASTGTPIWPWAAGAVLLLAAAGGLVWWRRARA